MFLYNYKLLNLLLILIFTILIQLTLLFKNYYNYSLLLLLEYNKIYISKFRRFFSLPLSLMISLIGSIGAFFYSLWLWYLGDWSTTHYFWIESYGNILSMLNIEFVIGIDSVSILMILLTTFILPLSLLTLLDRNMKEIMWMSINLLVIEIFILLAFMALDIFLFYISFESVLIPMFFLIGLGGSRKRKTKAAYYFFFFTFVGSLLMLIALIALQHGYHSSNYMFLLYSPIMLNDTTRLFIALGFLIAFAVKTPVFPVHLWLPEAHVEAPTTGSIILAALLLKLGTYGIYRYCILLLPYASFVLKPFVFGLVLISMTITSLIALRQTDLKRVVAYSSVVHMSYCLLGLFSFNELGIKGAFMLMIAHGLVSGGLFALVGVLYERYGTRHIHYYGGFAYVMPQTALFFFIAVLGNISFPISANFVGEIAVFVAAMGSARMLMLLIIFSLIVSTAYTVFLFNRVFFGALNTHYISIFKDINQVEFFVVLLLLYPMVFFGIFPDVLLNTLNSNVNYFMNLAGHRIYFHESYWFDLELFPFFSKLGIDVENAFSIYKDSIEYVNHTVLQVPYQPKLEELNWEIISIDWARPNLVTSKITLFDELAQKYSLNESKEAIGQIKNSNTTN